ncbi:hypothetical protein HZS_3278 [Henneguya salminicola]|uniref:Oxysterol-binding protein-related protein 10 (Trinotate prediction) n=1 Tax=Henneguya salminicola TaxID=69463 RepID=A0A6G3MF86_HENSL|nr:hypothetical protein HZS_3278 [Henneguya salminicola]
MNLPDDLFDQMIVIINSYLNIWKSFLQDQNFTGLPLYTNLNEFTRCKYSKSFQFPSRSVFNVVCQHIIEDSKDFYIFYLEDSSKTLTISFKICPKVSLIDDTIFVTLSGEGNFIHLLSQKEYSFTLPDIRIRNFYDNQSPELFGTCSIKNTRQNISCDLNFKNSPLNSQYLYGFIHHESNIFLFEGSWDDQINITDQLGTVIDTIKIKTHELYARKVSTFDSCHMCESKKLWRDTRRNIRQSNDLKFKTSINQVRNMSLT